MGDAPLRNDPEAMDELIARVLRRARQTAEDLNRVGFVTAATQVGAR
jgi:hypothetical protein